jgi:predicted DCC family thiol-disulfide oxidoreductase YuxK
LNNPILLFDGECTFCDGTVNWVIDRDPGARFRFAPLQSSAGQALCTKHGINVDVTDSLVVISDERALVYSSAAIEVARHLRWPWRALTMFWLIPRPIRNLMYRAFAQHRYRWFGRLEECRVPTPELRSRFLEGL